MCKATRINRLTDQACNALNNLIAPKLNRTWLEFGQDFALSFLPEVENEGSCGEGEGKAEKDSIDKEPDVRGGLWFEPGRHKPL